MNYRGSEKVDKRWCNFVSSVTGQFSPAGDSSFGGMPGKYTAVYLTP